MLALNLGTLNAGAILKLWARLFTNGGYRNAGKNSLVKFRKSPPFFGNYIDVAKDDRHFVSPIWSLEHLPVRSRQGMNACKDNLVDDQITSSQ
jgi:hypothetical protein